MKTAELIKQEFKELNAYLDDLYSNHKNMDAGNLWIQFTDKFNTFQKSTLESYASPVMSTAEGRRESYNKGYKHGFAAALPRNECGAGGGRYK